MALYYLAGVLAVMAAISLAVISIVYDRAVSLFRVKGVDGKMLILDNGECIAMAGFHTDEPARLESALRARVEGRLVRFVVPERKGRVPVWVEGKIAFRHFRYSDNSWSGRCADLFVNSRGEPLRDENGCVLGIIAFEFGSQGYAYLPELADGLGWLDSSLAACEYLQSWTTNFSEAEYRRKQALHEGRESIPPRF